MTEELSDLYGNCREAANILTDSGAGLKNMLSVLKMASDLLLPYIENAGDPRLDMYAAMLRHSYYGLLRLTNNIGEMGDVLNGGMALARTSFDIVAAVRDLAGTVDHLVRGSGARVLFESREKRCVICADRRRLDMLLLNLLSNSLQNAPGGLVRVSVVSCADRVVLCVSDNGPGIRGDALPSAWSSYGAPRALAARAGGAGMGLALVQHIARRHGGSAVLESSPGKGTTVTVSLPAGQPAARKMPADGANDDGGMQQLLAELSGVIGYEKYTQLYLD
ncbi:Histidine kinase-, DNA gyrase B-, and HSP90-like ATPase [Sporobacter termitidis DSM 10068]|uniref:histidine kinase n=1 Tax=Sporobacter termitidis DSM 10068 TaxID=1123282 RepID=A0A1M5Y561_9FIRM|nr:HAMP domain-containing sensor histidine kinase [Sporobacter termitidis]SHI07210.1 Histidine kinase-, DNA gyrase B-, and HSP90-like ATPase [Sporobacter termitidis DSM 10068]